LLQQKKALVCLHFIVVDSENSSSYNFNRLRQLLLLPQSAPNGSQSPDVNAGKRKREGFKVEDGRGSLLAQYLFYNK